MDRRIMNTIILDDDDLDCNCDGITLDDIDITKIGICLSDLEKFDMIFYYGNKGCKLLKSKYTKTGKIV